MLAPSFTLLALAALSRAIMVTFPTQQDAWSLNGPQSLTWTSVNTDRSTFAIVLVNQDYSLLSAPVVLEQTQSTSTGQALLDLPSMVQPGQNYQVNLVRSATELNTILAQSNMFTIYSDGTSSPPPRMVTVTTTATQAAVAVQTAAPAPPPVAPIEVPTASSQVTSSGSSRSRRSAKGLGGSLWIAGFAALGVLLAN